MWVAVWGEAHVLSAEVFVDIPLQPGEEKTWKHRYEFFSPVKWPGADPFRFQPMLEK
jgi:hypothetical protein